MYSTTYKARNASRTPEPNNDNNKIILLYGAPRIVHQTTAPYNPAQNGVAERMNRILLETSRSMMAHSNSPNYFEFWAEAINTAVYLRSPTPKHLLKNFSIESITCQTKEHLDANHSCTFLIISVRSCKGNLVCVYL